MNKTIWMLSLSGALWLQTVHAQITDADVQYTTVAEGLEIPWGMALLPNGRLLVTQRAGALSLVDLTTQQITAISGIPAVRAQGQGGFLDIALAPDFADSGWIYFTYSKEIDSQGTTTLARAKLVNNALTEWQDLFVANARTTTNQHYGSRIVFDEAGHVFFSIGDRGERDQAQDLSRHNGKIIRLNLDGSIPADNPTFSDDAIAGIWSYGHRNPQGMYYNPETQQLWAIEHGPRGGDEINLVEPGKNYGWPEVSLGREYWGPVSIGKDSLPDMEDPIYQFTPSIAPSGLIQYQGDAFPQLKGHLISGAMALQHLNIVTMNNTQPGDEIRLMTDQKQRIRNVIESPEGWLYVSTDSGQIIRLTPKQ